MLNDQNLADYIRLPDYIEKKKDAGQIPMAGYSVVRTNANVGKCVRIGSNVTICNNAVVSDGADVPDCTAVHPEVKK